MRRRSPSATSPVTATKSASVPIGSMVAASINASRTNFSTTRGVYVAARGRPLLGEIERHEHVGVVVGDAAVAAVRVPEAERLVEVDRLHELVIRGEHETPRAEAPRQRDGGLGEPPAE